MRDSFVLFTDIKEVVEALTDEQKGVLFQAILDYQTDKEPVIDDPVAKVAFIPIKQSLDRNNRKWEKEKNSRSEAGKKGAQVRWNKDDECLEEMANDSNAIANDSNAITDDGKECQDVTKMAVSVPVPVPVPVSVPVSDKDKGIDYQLIADMYNDTCVSFPKLTRLSDKRKKAIKARLKQYSVEDIKRAFEMAEESDFLKGGNNRDWSANFDWLMKDSNLAKVLDGNYKNKSPSGKIEIDTNFRKAMRESEVINFGM